MTNVLEFTSIFYYKHPTIALSVNSKEIMIFENKIATLTWKHLTDTSTHMSTKGFLHLVFLSLPLISILMMLGALTVSLQ